MSMFTLAVSGLITSNLPWLVDLTFQVPMQYCSLQHQTLLLSPVTSTTGYCFCFGPIPSFFLELFLHCSPKAYWAPTDLRRSSFSVLSFCLFLTAVLGLTHGKSPWCWERLRAEGEEGVRGWDGWMASLMQWTWTWANFRRWWGTGRPGVLQSMKPQRDGHDWATELNWTALLFIFITFLMWK